MRLVAVIPAWRLRQRLFKCVDVAEFFLRSGSRFIGLVASQFFLVGVNAGWRRAAKWFPRWLMWWRWFGLWLWLACCGSAQCARLLHALAGGGQHIVSAWLGR